MVEIGATLRAAREKQGISLEQAEQGTRIRTRFLEALENEEFDILGGDVYLRGFLRNYANFLGLEPDPLLEQLEPSPNPFPIQDVTVEREPRYLAEPLQDNPIPLGRILLMFVGLVLLGVVGVSLWSQPEQRAALLSQVGVTIPTATTGGGAEEEAVTERTVISQTTIIIEPNRSTPSAGGEVATPVPTATLPPRTPTPDPNATTPPTATEVAPPQDGNIVIDAEVVADTWVRVIVDRETQLERMLRPGESYQWVGMEEVRLRVGNAGGLRLTLNGQNIGFLGSSGEVIERSWRSDPDGGLPVQVDPQG